MFEYDSIVLNGFVTKQIVDKLLNESASKGFRIHSIVKGMIIILEREIK
jgi:hypothetical protein